MAGNSSASKKFRQCFWEASNLIRRAVCSDWLPPVFTGERHWPSNVGRVSWRNLLRQLKHIIRDSPDIGVDSVHVSIRIDHVNFPLRTGCFVEEAATQTTPEILALTLHSVERAAQATVGGFDGHVEHKN